MLGKDDSACWGVLLGVGGVIRFEFIDLVVDIAIPHYPS